MHSNSREEIKEVLAGDIAAAIGLKDVTTGDTLCDADNIVILERMEFPEPVISVAVEPKSKADQEKMGIALGKLAWLSLSVAELSMWLERTLGWVLFDPSVYYIGRLPSELQWLDVTLTVLVALALTLLATLYPALRAASIRPIEVLQDG